MQVTLELPDMETQHARNVAAWERICDAPYFRDFPGKVETDRFGHAIMSPPPFFSHGSFAGEIAAMLRQMLGPRVTTEIAISTSDGTKGPDVTWVSPERAKEIPSHAPSLVAPEICVEVLSPSNTPDEMELKRKLYFEAGAEEVWECDGKGNMNFYFASLPDDLQTSSNRCPEFPSAVKI